MSRVKFVQVYDGEWVQPIRRGYRMKCCDCGLVHRMDFKLIKYAGGKRHKIRFRAFRLTKPRKTPSKRPTPPAGGRDG